MVDSGGNRFRCRYCHQIRLLGIPLERDEGEYAYAGQLILQGIPPCNLAYNMKFPGTYAAYAAIMSIFGQTITGIHLGLLLINAATVVLGVALAWPMITERKFSFEASPVAASRNDLSGKSVRGIH
jgi:hypothetical protein